MISEFKRPGRLVTRIRRRAIMLAAYSTTALALSAAFAAAPAGGPRAAAPRAGAPATRGAVATRPAPNPAAAERTFQNALSMFNQQKYQDAQVENEKALQLDPTHSQALLLRRALEPKLAAGGTTVAGSATQAGTSVKPGILTAQQISMIRVMELSRKNETSVIRGTIDRKTLEDFWNEVYKKDPNNTDFSQAAHDRFINPNNFNGQLSLMVLHEDRKFLEKVNLISDPADMIPFKNTVHTYVMQNCATSECHGGDKAGKFRLLTEKSDAAIYTNFYIMSMFKNKDGEMLNRGVPDNSLLLQYSLPAVAAKTPHPTGELARKLAPNNDNRYRTIADWVASLAIPRPNYGISFELPTGSATQPR